MHPEVRLSSVYGLKSYCPSDSHTFQGMKENPSCREGLVLLCDLIADILFKKKNLLFMIKENISIYWVEKYSQLILIVK